MSMGDIMYKNRLRDLREDKDLKQKELAEYLKVHQTTYSDYELGNLNIPVNVLHALADFYGTSIDYLLGRTSEKTPYRKYDRAVARRLGFYMAGATINRPYICTNKHAAL